MNYCRDTSTRLLVARSGGRIVRPMSKKNRSVLNELLSRHVHPSPAGGAIWWRVHSSPSGASWWHDRATLTWVRRRASDIEHFDDDYEESEPDEL